MCEYSYQDKHTLEYYCELLDMPCEEVCAGCCPLTLE
jgi:hypothetical protein